MPTGAFIWQLKDDLAGDTQAKCAVISSEPLNEGLVMDLVAATTLPEEGAEAPKYLDDLNAAFEEYAFTHPK